MRLSRFSTIAVALVSTLPCAAADEKTLPNTRAGRIAAAFVEAFNSRDDDKVRAFEREFRSKSSLAERSIDDRVEQSHELRSQWGTLSVERVLDSAERSLSLLVKTSAAEEWLQFDFDIESEKPYRLNGVRVRGLSGPEEAEAVRAELSAEIRSETVDGVDRALEEAYVYPEIAAKMGRALRKHLYDGEYDRITSPVEFATRLTRDLRAVADDKHLSVRAGGGPASPRMRPNSPDGRSEARRSNYGFRKVEMLPGNIGYIRLDSFNPSKPARNTAAAALAFVRGADALIFDLRQNGGGSPEMIKFISSYLFDKPTHLNSFYNRLSEKTSETWTTEEVSGRRFGENVPVYILTSSRTFSAAEEFTYNLKHLGRATIVGETTGGGAHPVMPRRITDHFMLRVPYARAFNPITKMNWEGVGVIPHIKVAADDALEAARSDALERLGERRKQAENKER